MSSRRNPIPSTTTLFSIREFEDEDPADDADGGSIDMKGFLAEGENAGTMGEKTRMAPVDQRGEQGFMGERPFERQRVLEVHRGKVREAHEALGRCWSDPNPELLRAGKVSPGKTEDAYRWTPSEKELHRVYPHALTTDALPPTEPTPSLRGGGLLSPKNKNKISDTLPQRPQIIGRPSEAFDPVAESASRGLRGAQVGHAQGYLQAPGMSEAGLGYVGSALYGGYGGDSRAVSIAPEGSVASWYVGGGDKNPGVGERGTVGIYSGKEGVQEAVELPTSEISSGEHHDGKTSQDPPTISQLNPASSTDSADISPETKRGEVNELGFPMESPRKSTWRNFSRPPTLSSALGEGSGLGGSSYVSESTAGGQRMFFAPGGDGGVKRRVVGGGGGVMGFSGQMVGMEGGSYAPPRTSTEQDPYPPQPSTSPPPLNPQPTHLLPIPGNHSIWDGGSHPTILPEESPSEIAAFRAHQEALLHTNNLTNNITLRQNNISLQQNMQDFAQDPLAKERSEAQFREKLLHMWKTYQTRLQLIEADALKTGEEKKTTMKDEQRYLEVLIAQASMDTGFKLLHSPTQTHTFISTLFSPPLPSKTPALLRKTNKVIKWILAVPDDPELKTHSSRKGVGGAGSVSGAGSTVGRGGSGSARGYGDGYRVPPPQNARPQISMAGGENVMSPMGDGRRFHFAPAPVVKGGGGYQGSLETVGGSEGGGEVKGGKDGGSGVSRGTEWPTQSGVGGGRF